MLSHSIKILLLSIFMDEEVALWDEYPTSARKKKNSNNGLPDPILRLLSSSPPG